MYLFCALEETRLITSHEACPVKKNKKEKKSRREEKIPNKEFRLTLAL